MLKETTISPLLRSCHRSQRPAKAKSAPSAMPTWKGCFTLASSFCQSQKPFVGTRQRLLSKGSRKVGFVVSVSP
jgi:hypothetical protein